MTFEETHLLLQGGALEKLPAEILNKLEEIDVIKQRYFSVLPGNLQVLFDQQGLAQNS